MPGIFDDDHLSKITGVGDPLVSLLHLPAAVSLWRPIEHQRWATVEGQVSGIKAQPNGSRTNKGYRERQTRIFVVLGARKLRCFSLCPSDIDFVETQCRT